LVTPQAEADDWRAHYRDQLLALAGLREIAGGK